MEKSYVIKKRKTIKFSSKMPLGPTGQEFWPEYNFCILPRKLVDSIFIGSRNKWKNLLEEKKILLNFVQKCPKILLAKNFFWNTMSTFLHEKF